MVWVLALRRVPALTYLAHFATSFLCVSLISKLITIIRIHIDYNLFIELF